MTVLAMEYMDSDAWCLLPRLIECAPKLRVCLFEAVCVEPLCLVLTLVQSSSFTQLISL